MKRKYREVRKWREVRTKRIRAGFCDHCLEPIEPGTRYERRFYVQTSDMLSRENLIVMCEHLSPCCKEYEK